MLIRLNPRLRFDDLPKVDDPSKPDTAAIAAGAGGSSTPPVPPVADDDNTAGFPANTTVKDMTHEQQAAYWKSHSRRHESEATALRTEQAQREAEGRTDAEKREHELREEGKAQGAQPFIRTAVAAEIRVATGKTKEEVDNLLSFVDVSKFLTDGGLDDTKIATYASSVGVAAPQESTPSRNTALNAATSMQRDQPNGTRAGGSIAERRREIAAQYAGQPK